MNTPTLNTPTLTSTDRTGSFYSGALASGRVFDPADFVTGESILGLQREAGYVWGTLRDEDGTLYSTMRRIAPPAAGPDDGRSSLGGKLIVVSSGTDRGPGLQIRKEPRYAVDSSAIGIELTDANTATMSSAPDAPGQPMKLVLSQDDFHYVEEGVMDMSGRMVANPLQWYLPCLLYTSPSPRDRS